jgi:hypothetical protein
MKELLTAPPLDALGVDHPPRRVRRVNGVGCRQLGLIEPRIAALG